MVGLFQETGPCEVIQNPDGTYSTQPRAWGWDRSSNILFIDQPTQTGFSYDERVNASVDSKTDNPPSLASRLPASARPADVPEWRFRNGTFASGLTSNTEHLADIAARTPWHFLQGFLPAFPKYSPGARPGRPSVECADIDLFAESYGGTYGLIFADFYQEQNDRRTNGTIPKNALEIRLGSLGIVNSMLDVPTAAVAALNYADNNAYGYHWVDLTQLQNGISTINNEGHCKDLTNQCRASVAASDPKAFGNDETTNDLCAAALQTCTYDAIDAYKIPKNVYDIRVSLEIGPGASYLEYLNQAKVLQAIGAPVNITSYSGAVANAYNATESLYVADPPLCDKFADLLHRWRLNARHTTEFRSSPVCSRYQSSTHLRRR
jgi:carboxypeptidase C (cathepsin A)